MRKISTILICAMLIASSFIILIGNDVEAKDDGDEVRALYQIFTLADLQDINAHRDQDHILMNDIDASDTVNWNGGLGFDTIGGFSGTFDGQGYTISGLYMNRPTEDFVGLISIMTTGSIVSNLNLIDVDITGEDWVGGLVGIKNDGAINNCMVSGEVSGVQNVGGLIGQSSAGPITSSSSQGNVEGTGGYVGGLVGNNHNQIFDSYSQADVIGSDQANGGLVGFNQVTGEIRRCYATGSVYSTSSYVGGFAGLNYGDIYDSYALGDAETGVNFVGGFVGSMQETGSTTIENCYSTGTATGGTSGGFIGNLPSGTVTNCFWDSDTSGLGASAAGTGLTTAQALSQANYAGWDFGSTWWMGNFRTRPFLQSEYNTNIRNSHQLQLIMMDAGTLSADYQIMQDFKVDSTEPSSMWSTTTMPGNGFYHIGSATAEFTGTLNGNNHTISDLYIYNTGVNNLGLFGVMDTGSSISNVGLVNLNITGNDYVGGLVGSAIQGTISNCYASGKVSGVTQMIGGLVGHNIQGTISNCFSTVDVEGNINSGGLVGYNQGGLIENSYFDGDLVGRSAMGGVAGYNWQGSVITSYATGTITGTHDNIGGLVGYNSAGAVNDCYALVDVTSATTLDGQFIGGLVGYNTAWINSSYATGSVIGGANLGGFLGSNAGTVMDSFWDTASSAMATGIESGNTSGATGLTTAQAMTETTYTGSGWDFTNDWWMIEGETRPFLRMEYNTRITNSHELQLMAMDTTADYELGNDVQMDILDAAQMWGTNASNGGKGFLPIAPDTDSGTVDFQGTSFDSTFQGQGYSITGLYINRPAEDYQGLFGAIGVLGDVTDVSVSGDVTGRDSVGMLAGAKWNFGNVEFCSSHGVVSGVTDTGGLIGSLSGPIADCWSSCDVTGSGINTGGLTGNSDNTITRCNATGDVTGAGSRTGGLIGYSKASVTNSFTSSTVSGSSFVGGLVGQMLAGGQLSNCDAYGDITGLAGNVGGVVGATNGDVIICNNWGYVNNTLFSTYRVGGIVGISDGGTIFNCVNNGMIDSNGGMTGGIVGEMLGGSVSYSYNYNDIYSVDDIVGGIVGQADGASVTHSGNTGDVTGRDHTGGVIGRMLSSGTIHNSTSTGDIAMTLGGTLSGGFAGLSQANCIIRDSWSSGTVDGGSQPGMAGFIAENSGTITNCSAFGTVTGGNENGGFVCYNSGLIYDCQAYGNVSGYGTIGGFTSHNFGTIENSTAFGNASGTMNEIGGFAGDNNNLIYDCEAFGTVTGVAMAVGGIVGQNDGNITMCTNYGNISAATLNTWGHAGIAGLNNNIVYDCENYGDINGWNSVGGIAGENYGDVVNGINHGSINALDDCIGGIVGYNDDSSIMANVTNSISYGDVSGILYVGGAVGYTEGGYIESCTAYGTVNGTRAIGGSVGENHGTVIDSLAEGNVTGSDNDVGGLIGRNDGSVTNSSAYGNVNNTDVNTGGLIGYQPPTGSAIDCYAYGDVSSSVDYIGGLIGTNDGTVENCHADGDVTGYDVDCDYVGGSVGENWGDVSNSTANGDVYGDGFIGGFVGYHQTGTITNCHSSGDTTGIDINVGGFAGRNMDAINDCSAIGNVSAMNLYVGGFTGNNGGDITNCTSFGNTSGEGYVGGFVGWVIGGTITQCYSDSYSTGNTPSDDIIGGFVGRMFAGTISISYSTGIASGDRYVGGFAGYHQAGTIMDCYGTGDSLGTDFVGGFAGYNQGGTITNCYSVGSVSGAGVDVGGFIGDNGTGTNNDCFWDIETSGQVSSNGGTGNDTLEMMSQATFTNWNFTTVWGIYEKNTYPFLQAFGTTPPTPIADLDLTVDAVPSHINVGETVIFYVNITNDGPDNAVNVNVTVTGSGNDVIYQGNNQSADTILWQGGLSWLIGYLASGETAWMQVSLVANESGAFYLDGTSVSDIFDPNMGNNNVSSNVTMNTSPVAVDDTYTAIEDSGANTINVLTNDTDPDGDYLTIISVTQGVNGAVAIIDAGKNVTYEPSANWFGSDFFTYTISDGNGGTHAAIVNVTVTNVNDMPVITTADVIVTLEDVLYSVDYNATDIEGDVLNWSLNTNAGWLSIDNNTGNLSGTPTNADVGTQWVNVTVDDGNGGIGWSNFTITVTNVNDVPVAVDDVYSIDEDTPLNGNVLGNDNDPDTTDVFQVIDNDPLTANGLSITVNPDGIFTYLTIAEPSYQTLAVGESTTDTFNYTIHDGNGGFDNATVTITITGVNDMPAITAGFTESTFNTGSDFTENFTVTDGDTSDTLTWSITGPAWLSIDPATGELTGSPENADAGYYNVSVSVSDGNGGIAYSNATLLILLDTDGDGVADGSDGDDDNDGVEDVDDDFPTDPSEDTDTDGDGTGDNADTDDDGDGVDDVDDDFPLDDAETVDTDGDGTGNNADNDDDGDGVDDADDQDPLDPAIGEIVTETDTDDDGVPDDDDAFPNDATETVDTDSDGVGDNSDAFPSDATETTDTDGDGTGDNADAFPTDPSASIDADDDGAPDEWNPGYTAEDSTTGLVIDDIVEDDDDTDDTGDEPANNWLYIILILAVVGVIALLLIMKGKGNKDEPVAEETAEEPMDEAVDEPETEEPVEEVSEEPEQVESEDEIE